MRMNVEEAKKQVDNLYKQREAIDREVRMLTDFITQENLKNAQVNVGRCFKEIKTSTRGVSTSCCVCKIVSAPIPVERLTGSSLNIYQYPALFVRVEAPDTFAGEALNVPFYEETLFIKNREPADKIFEEISQDEFNAVFNKAVDWLKKQIGMGCP